MKLYHGSTVIVRRPSLLDAQAAILQLRAYKTYDQLSFHTQKVIDTLSFVESFEV